MDKVTWPSVALVGLVLAAITVLALAHVDASVILTAVTLMGLGGTAGVVMQMRTNLNGNTAKQLELIASALDKLAQAPAIPTEGNSGGQSSETIPPSGPASA